MDNPKVARDRKGRYMKASKVKWKQDLSVQMKARRKAMVEKQKQEELQTLQAAQVSECMTQINSEHSYSVPDSAGMYSQGGILYKWVAVI